MGADRLWRGPVTPGCRPSCCSAGKRRADRVWQWCQRSQALHLAPPAQRLEALDEALLPRRVPLGWVAIVRPDRCVLAEGPASEGEAMLRRALELVAPPASAPAATWPTPAYPDQGDPACGVN